MVKKAILTIKIPVALCVPLQVCLALTVEAPAGGAAICNPAQSETHLPVRGSGLRHLPPEELLLYTG